MLSIVDNFVNKFIITILVLQNYYEENRVPIYPIQFSLLLPSYINMVHM